MANIYANLPLPAVNGAGAAVDVSLMGGTKTFTVTGDLDGASITVECSADAGVTWGAVTAFNGSEPPRTIQVWGNRLRTFIRNAPAALVGVSVDVGAPPGGGSVLALAVPAGIGPGVGGVAEDMGLLKTFIVSGSFPSGSVRIEGSEDGFSWVPVVQFSSRGGLETLLCTFRQFRVNVPNRGTTFAAVVNIGAANDPVSQGQDPIVIGTAAILSGAVDPNSAGGIPLPAGALTGIYLQDNGDIWDNVGGTSTSWINTRASGSSSQFGDGSDGALVVAGVTTEVGATDRFWASMVIGAAGEYRTEGRRIWCQGDCNIGAGGMITSPGNPGVADAGGAAGTALNLFGGTAGGTADPAFGVGAAGAAASANVRCFSPTVHSAGGGGGAGAGGAGGASGAQAAAATTANGGRSSSTLIANGGFEQAGVGDFGIAPGTGGGAGAGDGVGVLGGGGGGGAGVVFLIAKRVFANGATPFLAAGGAGAAGAGAGAGGGGGAGGGVVVVICRQYSGTALAAAVHTPGGAAGAGGGGAGVDGIGGSLGFVGVFTI
jgi:hypothetical protein